MAKEPIPGSSRRFWLEVTDVDAKATKTIRDFCKWVLDLLRNIIVVGVLQYFAEKTGNGWLKALAIISSVALSGYIASYIQVFSPRIDLGKSITIGLLTFSVLGIGIAFLLILTNIGLGTHGERDS